MTSARPFKNLCSPAKIGNMALKNRMVMSPMTTAYCNDDQSPSERLMSYFEERAKGGVGLITLELVTTDEVHRYMHRSMTLGDDKYIDGHRELADRIHQHGAKVQPQISHTGPESVAPMFGGPQGIGPSVSVAPVWGWSSREMDISELPAIAEQYGEAARRAREAGYDGVELHAAHCYNLLASFLSPLRNKRQDDYSAFKVETRVRLINEVMQQIKSRAGQDFPVTLSLSGYERMPGGRSLDDTQRLAPEFVAAGVDCFRVSGGISDALVTMMVGRSEYGDAHNVAQAEAIKNVVDVPVMLVGRIHDPEVAEQILENGQADLIAMARPLLADPYLPQKVMAGEADRIRRCISCENCIDAMQSHDNLACAVNPFSGREHEFKAPEQRKADTPKKVVIVGGGTGGLEAARQASLLGHKVTVLEKQARIGGSLTLASSVHSDNQRYLDWLQAEVQRAPILLCTNTPATVDVVKAQEPDAVIVSTGATVQTPDIPGVEQAEVLTGALMRQLVAADLDGGEMWRLPSWQKLILKAIMPLGTQLLTPARLRWLSSIWMPLGKRVVIIGSDLAAIELAEFLAKRGRRVHVVDSAKKIIPEVGKKRRHEHMDRLDQLKVTLNTDVGIQRIEKDGVIVQRSGRERKVPADTVIVAGKPVADTRLADELSAAGLNVQSIGDSTGLGLIAKATHTATEAVIRL